MKDVLEGYTFITGRISPPPIWALGHHQCRWYDYSEADVLRIGQGWSGDSVELDGRPTLVQGCQFECENRGEACSFSFSV